MTVLLVTSSPRGDYSHSNKVAKDLASKLAASKGEAVVHRDLATDTPVHIDGIFTSGIYTPADSRSPEQAAAVDVSDKLVQELLGADTIVIGTGLINFNIYSTLKSYIDHIARAGLTFKYGESGPVGLLTGKKAYIVLASGGIYSEGPAAPLNHAVPYLKSVLGFIGITDVEVVAVEGVGMGPEAVEKAINAAEQRIDQLVAA